MVPVVCFNVISKLSSTYPYSIVCPFEIIFCADSIDNEFTALLMEAAEILASERANASIARSEVLHVWRNIPFIAAIRLH